MNSNWYKLIMKATKIHYGKKIVLKGLPVIYNTKRANLTIGDNVLIKSSFLSNLIGLYSRTIIVTRSPNAEIVVGNNVGISGATIYARKGIYIGDNTCIGGNSKILDNDFHPIEPGKRLQLIDGTFNSEEGMIPAKAIHIGRNCFIGCNCIILKGTVLGDNCVVGAGSVVTGIFPKNCIIAGNPAAIIRKIREV